MRNKKEKLEELLSVYHVTYQEVRYIDDDENDFEAMQACIFKACPLDAVPKIKEISDYISPNRSSEAAV